MDVSVPTGRAIAFEQFEIQREQASMGRELPAGKR
jgi:hypothetical protein